MKETGYGGFRLPRVICLDEGYHAYFVDVISVVIRGVARPFSMR